MDRLSKNHRSWNMSRIRGSDTKPEVAVRSILHRLGYRFRLHRRDLPGKPDIVLPRHRVVVFVHGCFWHRHRRCKYAYQPKSNRSFWLEKFAGTLRRDRISAKALRRTGWTVLIVWECEVRDDARLSRRLRRQIGARH